nr:hypothetical protein 2 [bacterium]
MEKTPETTNNAVKKSLPAPFKFALLLFFISLQCFLGALYLKERENYYKLESQVMAHETLSGSSVPSERTFVELEAPSAAIVGQPAFEETIVEEVSIVEEASVVTPAARPQPTESDVIQVKKKGTLWFDRQNESYVVTLGQKNGIENGATLKIYDSGSVIGNARVMNSMEKLSIVSLEDIDKSELTKMYYKVSVE